MFKRALREVRYGDTEDDLVDALRTINEGNLSPLPEGEVVKIANNVWNIEERGDNWVGQEARAVVLSGELEILSGNSDSALLLMRLRAAHACRANEFALTPALGTSLGWTDRRFRSAREFLSREDFIERTSKGGRGAGDPARYRLK